MQQVKAKKFLGQHFLKDLSIAQRIAETIDSGRVLEIGPGMGVLTQFLLQNEKIELTAIEIDTESVAYLNEKKQFNSPLKGEHWDRLRLIEGDFLKLPIDEVYPISTDENADNSFNVIGNYPYNISSQIFFKVLDYKDRIPVCSGMIQREVALRLAAKPGNKDYGILSVLMQTWYDIEYLFTVDEHVFNPPPKVKSAVIRFTRNERKQLDCDESLYKAIVKTAFNQRRKQMRNPLKGIVEQHQGEHAAEVLANPIFTKRPEQLSVEEFISLTKMIQG